MGLCTSDKSIADRLGVQTTSWCKLHLSGVKADRVLNVMIWMPNNCDSNFEFLFGSGCISFASHNKQPKTQGGSIK